MANLHLHKGAHSFSSWERGCSSQELAGKLFFSYLGIIHKIGSFRKNHQHYFRKGCELWRRLDRNIRWLEPVSIFTMTSLYYICLPIFTLKDLKYEYHHFTWWCFCHIALNQPTTLPSSQPYCDLPTILAHCKFANQRHNNWNCRRDKFTAVCPNNVPEAANVSLVQIKLALFCSI